jgi:V/A-type H+-transporting ATPase subunit I
MKRVSLVVLDRDQDVSLEKLRDLGVMHLEKKPVQSDALTRLLEKRSRSEAALGLLRASASPKGKAPVAEESGETIPRRRKTDRAGGEDFYSVGSVNVAAEPDTVTQVLNLGEEKKNLQEQLAFQTKERSRIEKWGNFDPRAFAEFARQGISLIPYELSPRVYASLPEDARLIVLEREKTLIRALSVGAPLPGESPWQLPERSLAETSARIAEIHDRLADIDRRLALLSSRIGEVEQDLRHILSRIEFETAKAGLDTLEDAPGDLTVAWLSGFVPAEDVGLVKRAAAENGWALLADDPGMDDPVPTKLKNNRLVSLIYPLTDFLETVPGYDEVDISGWFLLFFCVFFGMIFGDAGYGLLLMLIGFTGVAKTAKKGTPPALKMLLLLSFSNVVWGVITGTWFGIDAAKLPAFLTALTIPPISNATAARSPEAKALVDQNLQIFCFSLALLQLSIAHIKGIARNIRSLKFLGELGSLAMLAGMFNVVLTLVVSNSVRPIPFLPASLYVIIGGFVLSFVFAAYEGSIIRSIINSLQNIISVVLGITNVFSDIMSYIRLWAVGLAGASISATVNAMAGPLLGNFLVFLGIILLVFGHGLNIILNVLSVLVHGVRLNTLEFSGHLGLTWSGTAYKPFAKTDKK